MEIIMFKEKYCDKHFPFSSEEELKKIFLKILKERKKEGLFSNDYLHSEMAYSLIKKGKKCGIWELKSFFNNRKYYEYEYYEIVKLEKI